MRVAVAQYAIGEPADFAAFATRVATRVAVAAHAGAHCIVLPEYLALEAAAGQSHDVRADFVRSLAALQSMRGDYEALASELARRHAIHLVAGTFLVEHADGRYRNRAWLATPAGTLLSQDKLCLTGFERASGVIDAGDAIKVFETEFGRIGIDVCYDIEFPLYARAQAEAGANLLLVPSCTDTAAGANRVRIGCQARALENQAFVACAVTSGAADWSPALDRNTGAAAVYTPVDRGFPEDGIAAIAAATDDWAFADVDLDALARVRREGQVANAADWSAQQRPAVARARVERA
ncbi:carbon-nitrogen hydrolase family protein [Dokdonella sp.]|uniref:carbon-nitrogen hydrolase family protein n=1 Tax=Dokdonella sp. TaxID=2291710 RepID=UPI002F412C15